MPYFTEQARTYTECMERIRAKYGKDAKVLIEKTVRKGGFLGMGGHEEVEMTGVYGYTPAPRPSMPEDLETAKRQVLAAASKAAPEASNQAVLKEVANLNGTVRSLIEKMDAASSPSVTQEHVHPSLKRLEEDLLNNEFTPSFIKMILDRVRREFPLHELDDYEEVQKKVVFWIGEKIFIYKEPESAFQGRKKPRVIVVVGPTGVGKTTTVVKLAALYGERERAEGFWKKSVRLITVDCFRIGAEYQLQKYGEIMGVPVNSADSYDSLKQLFALYRQDIDFILVDTIGKSPRSYAELGEVNAMLDACPAKKETHLCVQASTKAGDLREMLKQFEPFKYKSVIITKMDETSRIGNIISVLAEEQKSISFIASGQGVPWDIDRATVIQLLINLDGFTVDRPALVDHFRALEDNINQTGTK